MEMERGVFAGVLGSLRSDWLYGGGRVVHEAVSASATTE